MGSGKGKVNGFSPTMRFSHRTFHERVSRKILRWKGYPTDVFFLASGMEIIHNNAWVFFNDDTFLPKEMNDGE